jgi:hypothetical protein
MTVELHAFITPPSPTDELLRGLGDIPHTVVSDPPWSAIAGTPGAWTHALVISGERFVANALREKLPALITTRPREAFVFVPMLLARGLARSYGVCLCTAPVSVRATGFLFPRALVETFAALPREGDEPAHKVWERRATHVGAPLVDVEQPPPPWHWDDAPAFGKSLISPNPWLAAQVTRADVL